MSSAAPAPHRRRSVAGRLLGRARADSGASMVIVALCMPAMLLFLSFVIDVANGYVHSKHLQMQADAGALAAAADYQRPCSPADNTAIKSTAELYGGMTKTLHVDNTQIGGTPAANVKMHINKRTWPDQPDKVDDLTEGEPCERAMIDVKLTERDLPLFVGVPTLDAFKFINAHARVEFMKAFSTSGAMPLAVPMPAFETAQAVFVDESKAEGDPARHLKTVDLAKGGTAGSVTYWQSALSDVTVDAANVGVRVILSETTSTTCGEPGVFCYDAGSTDGLAHVRGWSTGDTTTVRARDVRLLQGTCPDDPYFTYVTATCQFGASADLAWGSAAPSDLAAVGAKAWAVVGSTELPLVHDGAGRWTAEPTIAAPNGLPLAPADRQWVSIKWEQTSGTLGSLTCKNNGSNPCKGTISNVSRAMSSSDARSGPLREVQVFSADTPVGANTFERSTTPRQLGVRIGIGGLERGPKVILRVGAGSLTQSIDCDPDVALFRDEMLVPTPSNPNVGCDEAYKVQTTETCPKSSATFWALPEPRPCALTEQGAKTSIITALNERILGDPKPPRDVSACTAPNNWPDFAREDPRLVKLFLTPYSSFSDNGQTTYPVRGFAGFYVTGWASDGDGTGNPCSPKYGGTDETGPTGERGGYIVGHFVDYIDNVNDGQASDEPCGGGGLAVCVPVQTR